jgi:hypothetical protein
MSIQTVEVRKSVPVCSEVDVLVVGSRIAGSTAEEPQGVLLEAAAPTPAATENELMTAAPMVDTELPLTSTVAVTTDVQTTILAEDGDVMDLLDGVMAPMPQTT